LCYRLSLVGCCLTVAAPVDAQITRIVIDSTASPAFGGASFGRAGQYETISGTAFGELDPADRRNAIITDIALAPRNPRGRVEYAATFHIVRPRDPAKVSGLLWHDVPNRGGRITLGIPERTLGDIGLSSGWQGDRSGTTAPGPGVEYATVPRARGADGSAIIGRVFARIMNAAGPDSRPLLVYANPHPYPPRTLDTRDAVLTTRTAETVDGRTIGMDTVRADDWAWARCSPDRPFPGTPDSTQICLRSGFDPALLYQAEFTAQDPSVLGIGFAAFRDVATFFRTRAEDDAGTPNPLAGTVRWMITRGVSQSGNFIRAFLQLGFNERLDGQALYDGAWPIIAGRRISLNTRFATPDGILALHEAGSEGPQWWEFWPDTARDLPPSGILDRCTRSGTCPRIVEHFGSAEVWGLKLSPAWVGAVGDTDIPLPATVRRYYLPSTGHGGGSGAFTTDRIAPQPCPSVGSGLPVLAPNPLPHTETVAALRMHLRAWVMRNTPPPASRWPQLADGTLARATKEALGYPTLPGLPPDAPTGLINPLIDYDWGPGFDRVDGSGVTSNVPPPIRRVYPMFAPTVDADGNERGGVPIVMLAAPLGTYLGWNLSAAGFRQGQRCSFAAGFIPFATTRAERLAAGDSRPSLEERYGDHAGYVRAVRTAAQEAVRSGFLLDVDAQRLVIAAQAGTVLRP